MKYVKYGLMGCGGVTLAFVALALVVAVVSAIAGGDDETAATGGGDMPPTVPTTIEVEVVAIETTTTQAPTTTRATTTTTTQATTTTMSEDIIDIVFVSAVRAVVEEEYSLFAAYPDEDIVEMGHMMCDVMYEAKEQGKEPGVTMLQLGMIVLETFDDTDFGATYAGALVGASPPAYCPENELYSMEMIQYASDF